jgi:hypothetical protein
MVAPCNPSSRECGDTYSLGRCGPNKYLTRASTTHPGTGDGADQDAGCRGGTLRAARRCRPLPRQHHHLPHRPSSTAAAAGGGGPERAASTAAGGLPCSSATTLSSRGARQQQQRAAAPAPAEAHQPPGSRLPFGGVTSRSVLRAAPPTSPAQGAEPSAGRIWGRQQRSGGWQYSWCWGWGAEVQVGQGGGQDTERPGAGGCAASCMQVKLQSSPALWLPPFSRAPRCVSPTQLTCSPGLPVLCPTRQRTSCAVPN